MNPSLPIDVVVVEDQPTTRLLIQSALEQDEKYRVVGLFANGDSLLQALPELQPDIILMDISLGEGIDGVQAAARANAIHPCPVVFVSAQEDQETIAGAMRVSPNAFVTKPISIRELKITIDFTVYRHRMERRIQQGKDRIIDILGHLRSGILYLDEARILRYMNDTFKQWTGISSAALPDAADAISFQDPADGVNYDLPALLDRIEAGQPHVHLLFQPPAGQTRYLLAHLSRIDDPVDQGAGWILQFEDKTDERNIRNELETAFHALESLDDAVVVTGAFSAQEPGAILYRNQSFKSVFAPLLQDRNPISLAEFDSCLPAGFADRLRSEFGKKRADLLTVTSPLGTSADVCLTWRLYPMKLSVQETPLWVHVVSDVSVRRQLEEELRQSQKLEAIGQLAGGIAHDFNNILSIINSYADLLQLALDKDSNLQEYVRNIADSGRRGAALVAQIMHFARHRDDEDEQVEEAIDAVEIITSMQSMFKRLIREDIEIQLALKSDHADIATTRSHFEQILINLLVNAQDAIQGKGHIRIEAEVVETDGPPPGLASDSVGPGAYLRITVSDSGSGIPPEIRIKIFDPFFTTKEIGKGTGMGLSTVFGIVSRAGGSIHVESEVGAGSSFHIYLPVCRHSSFVQNSTAAALEEPEPVFAASENHCLRTIVLEDDEFCADCIVNVLSYQGFEIYRPEKPAALLQMPPEQIRSFQLLITDIVMPEISGIDMARKLLEIHPGLKILFITGYSEHIPHPSDFPTAIGILNKPFSLSALASRINDLTGIPSKIHASTRSPF